MEKVEKRLYHLEGMQLVTLFLVFVGILTIEGLPQIVTVAASIIITVLTPKILGFLAWLSQ